MRAWLAICAVALTACAAEPEAEAHETKVSSEMRGGLTEADLNEGKTLRLQEASQPNEPKIENEPAEKFVENTSYQTGIDCHGIAKQGGLVVCQTQPNARVEVGRSENDTYVQTADKDGVLLVGFDRDEPAAFVRVGDARVNFNIQKRKYDISRIDGLPKRFVSEYTPEQLAQIRKASALKKVGFASAVEELSLIHI